MKTIPITKAKIVATYGPSIADEAVLEQLILSGLSVVRFNFSHGDHDFHKEGMARVRKLNQKLGSHVAILGDLQGPKIRIGEVDGSVELITGEQITISPNEAACTTKHLTVRYPTLMKDIQPGERILINDGRVEIRAVDTKENGILCDIIEGGVLTSRKGVNFPDSDLSVPTLTEKDEVDLAFAMEQEVNWVALSFVRHAKDMVGLKERLGELNSFIKVIAKVEKPEALQNLEGIVEASDGVMVARGDLGVEIPQEQVPLAQKNIIQTCLRHAKPVIVATHMMESMIESPVPTRAEINDVANAILDGADAVMLSGETSVGKFPVKTVQTMRAILDSIEARGHIFNKTRLANVSSESYESDALCNAACHLAQQVEAKAIIGMTKSGYTAFMIASTRPVAPVYIFTDNRPLLNTLNLLFGVHAFFYDGNAGTDETIEDVIHILKLHNFIEADDLVVNLASMPFYIKGRTNTIKITKVQ